MSDEEKLSVRGVFQRTLLGSGYSIVGQAITTVTGLARSILVARLLRVEEIGLVALALVFSNFLRALGDFGLNQALVQRKEVDDSVIATQFMMRMGLALASFGLTLAVWPLLNRFYPGRAQLGAAVVSLGAIQLMMAATSTQLSLFNRNLLYRRLTALSVISSILITIAAPLMAWSGWGIWSLIIGEQFLGSLVMLAGLWLWRPPWRLTLRWNRTAAGEYFHFGKYIQATIQLTYFLDQFDDFWTGTFLGNAALGLYSKAYEFARYPRRLIARPLLEVFFATFSRLQGNNELLGKAFFQFAGFILRVNFFFSSVLFVVAPDLIPFLLGEQWRPMVVPFRWMLVYILLDPLLAATGNLTTAMGRPSAFTRTRVVQSLVFVPSVIILGGRFGISGVAIAADIMVLVGVVGVIGSIRKVIAVPLRPLLLPPLLAAALSSAAALSVAALLPTSSGPVLRIMLITATSTVVYPWPLLLLERDSLRAQFAQVMRFARQR